MILDKLKAVELQDDNVSIAGHLVPYTEGVRKALQDLAQVDANDCDLPQFSASQIIESRHFDASEGFDITMQVQSFADLLSIESVAWLCFSVQLAQYEPELADGVQLRALSFKTIFDNVQFLKLEVTQLQDDILELKIHFQWLKRFANKLK